MHPKILIKKSSRGEFYFNLCATNGQIVASSEFYMTEAAVLNAIASMKKIVENGVIEKLYQPK